MQAYLQKYNLFPKKSLCWGKIIEIQLNRDFVFLYHYCPDKIRNM